MVQQLKYHGPEPRSLQDLYQLWDHPLLIHLQPDLLIKAEVEE